MFDTADYTSYTLHTVTAFELFLLSADAALLDRLFGFFAPDDIMVIHGLSRRAAAAMQFYIQRTWNTDTFLSHWLSPAVIPDFYPMLDQADAIVSGSSILQFLDRQLPYPDSDLDIFVSLPGLLELGRWLQSRAGYTYRPRGDGPLLYFDVAALTLPARWMAGKHADRVGHNGLMFSTLFKVFDFEKPQLVVRGSKLCVPRVQLVAVPGDPREHILTFHSTAVMNFMTGTYVASLFPISTFTRRVSWVCRASSTVSYSRGSWKEKYEGRGFEVVAQSGGHDGIEPDELEGSRSIADCHTWFMFFEGQDRAKVREECEWRDVSFDVITRQRGPVRAGTYMNLVPPFTVSACAFAGDSIYEEEWPFGGTLETFGVFGA